MCIEPNDSVGHTTVGQHGISLLNELIIVPGTAAVKASNRNQLTVLAVWQRNRIKQYV